MQRINTPDGKFHAGDPFTGLKGTIVTSDWMQTVQEELASIPESVGIKLSPAANMQVLTAIRKLIADAVAKKVDKDAVAAGLAALEGKIGAVAKNNNLQAEIDGKADKGALAELDKRVTQGLGKYLSKSEADFAKKAGDAAQTFQVADATEDGHALNLRSANGHYAKKGDVRVHGSQLFTQNGKMTVPDGVTDIYVTGCGAGAGGGAGAAAGKENVLASGGGGGSGEWCIRRRIPVRPGQTLTIKIGGGGVGAASTKPRENGGSGQDGGITTIYELDLILEGGKAGSGAVLTLGPSVMCSFPGSGGKGGQGGQAGGVGAVRYGVDGDRVCPGGNGGSTPFGGGGVTTPQSLGGDGDAGKGYGSGGSGGQPERGNGFAQPLNSGGGGSGAQGMLLIEW